MPDDEPGQGGEGAAPGGVYRVTASPLARRLSLGRERTLESEQERTRRHVALILVGVLSTVALSLVALVAAGKLTIDDAKDLAATVLSPVVAVTGTALGFYFGAQNRRSGT